MLPARDSKHKALVAAALAGALYASSSGAEIVKDSLDAELFLNLINTTAGVSATFDLGIPTVVGQPMGSNLGVNPTIATYSTDALAPKGIKLQWNLAPTSAWSSFVAASGASLSNSKYDIKAVGPSDAFSGDVVFLTTLRPGVPANNPGNQLFDALVNFSDVGATFVADTNTQPTHASQADGANFATSATQNLYHQTAVGDNWRTSLLLGSGVSTGPIGSDLPFYKLYGDIGNLGGTASWLPYGGAWNLSATGLLTYSTAPVPEPQSWALLVTGLAAVGACVRRRGAAQQASHSS